MKYLAVLTPPALMCAVFLIAVAAFLRREMRGGRRGSEDLPEQNFPDVESFQEGGSARVPDTQFSDPDGTDRPAQQ